MEMHLFSYISTFLTFKAGKASDVHICLEQLHMLFDCNLTQRLDKWID